MQRGITKTGGTNGWRLLRQRIIARDEGLCAFCGQPGTRDDPISVDHIIPRSLGGSDHPDNLRLLHRRENSARTRTRRPVMKQRKPMTTTVHNSPFTKEYTV